MPRKGCCLRFCTQSQQVRSSGLQGGTFICLGLYCGWNSLELGNFNWINFLQTKTNLLLLIAVLKKKEENKHWDKRLQQPSILCTSRSQFSLFLLWIILSPSRFLWRGDRRCRKLRWYLWWFLSATVCLTTSAAPCLMVSADLFLSVPAPAWAIDGLQCPQVCPSSSMGWSWATAPQGCRHPFLMQGVLYTQQLLSSLQQLPVSSWTVFGQGHRGPLIR